MNRDDFLAAEYVIGTLDAAERAEVRTRIAVDVSFEARVRRWERALAPLYELVTPIAPPPGLWRAIADDVGRAGSDKVSSGRRGRRRKDKAAAPSEADAAAIGSGDGHAPPDTGKGRSVRGALVAPFRAVTGLVRGLKLQRKAAGPSEPRWERPDRVPHGVQGQAQERVQDRVQAQAPRRRGVDRGPLSAPRRVATDVAPAPDVAPPRAAQMPVSADVVPPVHAPPVHLPPPDDAAATGRLARSPAPEVAAAPDVRESVPPAEASPRPAAEAEARRARAKARRARTQAPDRAAPFDPPRAAAGAIVPDAPTKAPVPDPGEAPAFTAWPTAQKPAERPTPAGPPEAEQQDSSGTSVRRPPAAAPPPPGGARPPMAVEQEAAPAVLSPEGVVAPAETGGPVEGARRPSVTPWIPPSRKRGVSEAPPEASAAPAESDPSPPDEPSTPVGAASAGGGGPAPADIDAPTTAMAEPDVAGEKALIPAAAEGGAQEGGPDCAAPPPTILGAAVVLETFEVSPRDAPAEPAAPTMEVGRSGGSEVGSVTPQEPAPAQASQGAVEDPVAVAAVSPGAVGARASERGRPRFARARSRWQKLAWGVGMLAAVVAVAVGIDLLARASGNGGREPRSVALTPVFVANPPPDVRLRLNGGSGRAEVRIEAPVAPPGRIYRLRLKTAAGAIHVLGTFKSSFVASADLGPLLSDNAPGTARLSVTLDPLDDSAQPGEEIYNARIGE